MHYCLLPHCHGSLAVASGVWIRTLELSLICFVFTPFPFHFKDSSLKTEFLQVLSFCHTPLGQTHHIMQVRHHYFRFKKKMISESEGEGERETSKLERLNISTPAQIRPGDGTCNPGSCLGLGINPRPFSAWANTLTIEQTSQGLSDFFILNS